MATRARARRVPARQDGFAADYADCFRVPGLPDERCARDWAGAALAGAEVGGGVFSGLVWGGVLGFDLAPRATPDTVAGWRVVEDGRQRLVLDVDGSRMAGRMVFTAGRDEVTWTTMLRFQGRSGRRIWQVAGPVHRVLAPRCLEWAHHVLRRRPAA